MKLLITDAAGVYIPQQFAENFSDLIDDNGQMWDAKENPYATRETIEWNCDNTEGFEDQLYANEIYNLVDALLDSRSLHDYLTYHSDKNDKPTNWALKNFENLEFCLEHNCGYHCNYDNLGKWVKFDASSLQEKSGPGHVFDGIWIGTIGNLGEIEIQAENGKCHYLAGLTNDYFKIIARVA
jgi:hypothetical protein